MAHLGLERASGSPDSSLNAQVSFSPSAHFVNVSGSFIVGFYAGVTDPQGFLLVSPRFREFFMIGVCGGYTTFSSFSLQTLDLARDGDWLKALLNTLLSSVVASQPYGSAAFLLSP